MKKPYKLVKMGGAQPDNPPPPPKASDRMPTPPTTLAEQLEEWWDTPCPDGHDRRYQRNHCCFAGCATLACGCCRYAVGL